MSQNQTKAFSNRFVLPLASILSVFSVSCDIYDSSVLDRNARETNSAQSSPDIVSEGDSEQSIVADSSSTEVIEDLNIKYTTLANTKLMNTGRCISNPDDTLCPIRCDEACDDYDNDCNNEVDEGDLWVDKGKQCFFFIGDCYIESVFVCDEKNPYGSLVCDFIGEGELNEVCDGYDNDCDGLTDEGYADNDNDGIADCIDENDDNQTAFVEDGGIDAQLDDGRETSDADSASDGMDAEGDIGVSEEIQNDASDVGSGYDRFSCDDKTCTDQTTELQWQRCGGGHSGNDCGIGTAERKVWQSAVDYCSDLHFAEQNDWRLPSIYELISIIDFSKTDPAIDTNYFPNAPPFGTWSSTDVVAPYELGWVAAWFIKFRRGWIGYDQKTSETSLFSRVAAYARCVRGPKINARTFTKKDLVVFDDASSLMWQACSAGQVGTGCLANAETYSWQDAQDYCDALSDYANYSDWRLPGIRELLSLIDYTKANPAVDGIAFPETRADGYWSSTPILGYSNLAWYVDFNIGHTRFDRDAGTGTALVTQRYYVRCVRGEL